MLAARHKSTHKHHLSPTPGLCDPEPYSLEDISWCQVGPLSILCIERRLAGVNIGVFRTNPFCALEDLPESVKTEEDWDTNVCSEEV